MTPFFKSKTNRVCQNDTIFIQLKSWPTNINSIILLPLSKQIHMPKTLQ
jgi:hypothetical protein